MQREVTILFILENGAIIKNIESEIDAMKARRYYYSDSIHYATKDPPTSLYIPTPIIMAEYSLTNADSLSYLIKRIKRITGIDTFVIYGDSIKLFTSSTLGSMGLTSAPLGGFVSYGLLNKSVDLSPYVGNAIDPINAILIAGSFALPAGIVYLIKRSERKEIKKCYAKTTDGGFVEMPFEPYESFIKRD